MKTFSISVMLAVLAVCSGGCSTQHPPLVVKCGKVGGGHAVGAALVGQEYSLQATPIPLDSVQFSSWDTTRLLSVQRLYAARTPTNTVEVTARFVSCSDTPFNVRVRTSFVDANQAPTEPVSAWKTVYLQPRLTAVYSEYSTSRSATRYLIEVTPDPSAASRR
ncbi:MAG: hypothetical protein ACJ8R9_24415 [Steroidobacteraceae bacterium]